jgi:hypothetical protein
MQQLVGEERREFQRLTLDPPIPATFGATAVSILEIGVLGARIHHAEPLDIHYAELRFSYKEDAIALKCELVRTFASRHSPYPDTGLESGVRFVAAIGESGDHLRAMLSDLVVKEFESSRPPMPKASTIDGDKTVRGRDARFLCFRLDAKSGWSKRRVFLPEQPPIGFTVAANEDWEEMQRLCAVYESADEEGRRLIRLFAELSVRQVLEIPPSSPH